MQGEFSTVQGDPESNTLNTSLTHCKGELIEYDAEHIEHGAGELNMMQGESSTLNMMQGESRTHRARCSTVQGESNTLQGESNTMQNTSNTMQGNLARCRGIKHDAGRIEHSGYYLIIIIIITKTVDLTIFLL